MRGTVFCLESLEKYQTDPHFRGSFHDHPQHGDISDDTMQVMFLYESISRDIVTVSDGGEDRTDEAKDFVENVFDAMHDSEDDDRHDDEDYEAGED